MNRKTPADSSFSSFLSINQKRIDVLNMEFYYCTHQCRADT